MKNLSEVSHVKMGSYDIEKSFTLINKKEKSKRSLTLFEFPNSHFDF